MTLINARTFKTRTLQRCAWGVVAAGTLLLGSGCALLIGGAVVGGTAMVASDRRTAATQLEDQSIEVKAGSRIREALADRQHININSFNRAVLLTGEVNNDADRATAEQAVAKVDGVKSVVNEIAVMWPSSMTSRSNDVVISSKVKATLIDAKGLQSNAFNVVVERGIVYLQGRVTEGEANRAVDLVRTIAGVQKVVRVMEVVSDAELGNPPTK